jgi:hypothetical protein
MKKELQLFSIFITCLLAAGGNDLWFDETHHSGYGTIVLTDTVTPTGNPNAKEPFKKKFEYDKEGKITFIETEEHNIKIEYDSRCNKQTRSTRISKQKGDSVVYNFTYNASCQLATGESSDGIKLGFKFDSLNRLITIIEGSRKINIVYSNSGLPRKVSLGNRDYLDNIYDSSGKIMSRRSYSWWRPPVGTYRVFRIMYPILKDTETLFGRLVKFNPGFNIAEIRYLVWQFTDRPPIYDP